MGERKLTQPSCGQCRWAKKLRAPATHRNERGVELGVAVYVGPWPGVEIDGQSYKAIGGHYCEHFDRPRGLVLSTYHCRDFDWPDTVENQAALPAGRSALEASK